MRQSASILAVAVLLAACSGGSSSPPPPPPPTGAIRLNNSSSYPIDELYVALSSAPTWGSDRAASPILSGSSLTVSGLVEDFWDVRAVSIGTSSPYFAYAYNQWVVADTILDLSAYNSSFTGSLRVTNGNSTYDLVALYVVPSGSGSWGTDQLTSDIAPGYSFLLYGIPAGTYAVRCDHWDGGTSTGTWTINAYSTTSITCS
jgi:hypothetical protein